MELQKQNSNKIPTALSKIMQNDTVQLLAGKRMDVVSNSLPSRIEGTFSLPKVFEMVQATSRENVIQFIEFELVALAHRVSVGGNIKPGQNTFIASQLIDLFPNETIADFKICFQ